MIEKRKQRSDIQLLRGLAVLSVLLFHANENLFPNGNLGVDVFFVISGFVVTPLIIRIFENNSRDLVRYNFLLFLRRRTLRIIPALLSTLLFSSILIFFFAPVRDFMRFGKQGIATLLIVGNFGAYKYGGDYFNPTPNPLLHTWSLAVEEQIYISIPLLLLICLRNNSNVRFKLKALFSILTLTSLIIATSSIFDEIYRIQGIASPSQFSFYSPFNRLWQFLIGGLLQLSRIHDNRKSSRFDSQVRLILAFSMIIILFSKVEWESHATTFIVSGLTVFALAFHAFDLPNTKLSRSFVWLGNRSFSIYLFHLPLIYVAENSPLLESIFKENRGFPILIAVLLSFVLGALNFQLIEERFRQKKSFDIPPFLSMKRLGLVYATTFVVFLSLTIGAKYNFWNLNKSVNPPQYAGSMGKNCELDTQVGPPCLFVNLQGANEILLIGDSHGGMLAKAFIEAVQISKMNSIVWTHSGCRFQRTDLEEQSESCQAINRKIIEFAKKRKPHAILISQSFDYGGDFVSIKDSIKALKKFSTHVALVGPFPMFSDGSEFMQGNQTFLMKTYIPPRTARLRDMVFHEGTLLRDLENWSAKNGVAYIPVKQLFCDDEYCTRYYKQAWLYRDASHLSFEGAKLVIPLIAAWLNEI